MTEIVTKLSIYAALVAAGVIVATGSVIVGVSIFLAIFYVDVILDVTKPVDDEPTTEPASYYDENRGSTKPYNREVEEVINDDGNS